MGDDVKSIFYSVTITPITDFFYSVSLMVRYYIP